jgi:hypothetical protein
MRRILFFMVVLFSLLNNKDARAQCTLTLSTIGSNTLCSGQTVTLVAIGAANYTWYPGALQGSSVTVSPNQSGTYTVVATSGTCTSSSTLAVSVFSNPVLAISASSSSICQGSAATLTVSGAQSYTWQAPVAAAQQNQAIITVTASIPTLYIVLGTNSQGCSSFTTHIILPMPPSNPNLNLSAVNNYTHLCNGRTATLVANSGGNLSWSNGSSSNTIFVTPTLNTVYTCTATNPVNGCSITSSITISVYTTTVTVSGPTLVCSDALTVLTASGAASYTWSTGATSYSTVINPSGNTAYTVAGYSNNCISTQTINVAVLPSPLITASVSNLVICNSEESVLTAGGALSYTWSNGMASPSITFTPGQNGYPATTTAYTVTGTGANNCQGIAIVTQYVSTCTGLEDGEKNELLLQVYPNPGSDTFIILTEQELTITLLNELGQVVVSQEPLAIGRHELHLGNLNTGLYILMAEGRGLKTSQKLFINR